MDALYYDVADIEENEIIPLGISQETNVRQIVFNCGSLVESYGDGNVQIINRRPKELVGYCCENVVKDGDYVTWTVNSDDTAFSGHGHVQLRWYVNGALKESFMIQTYIRPSITSITDLPEEVKSALDLVMKYVEENTIDIDDLDERIATYFDENPLPVDGLDTELKDIRVGADGVTYPSAGDAVRGQVGDLKEDYEDLEDRVTAFEDYGGGISMTAVNLLDTILSEAVYGTDQTANIALLKRELSNIPPVSISAVLDGTALEGQNYSELGFIVTATFDDESAVVVDDYRVVTTGTVVAGSNTVTIRYRGVTTTCTFTAEAVITYSITYNLSNVTSSNITTVVVEGSYYSTVLSIQEEYGFDGCTVTMGGVDVTSTVYSNMEILITQVTGDIVITASATEIVPITDVAHYTINTRVYSYSDDGQTSINNNYYGSELYYTKHNFAKASKVTITVANNTDSDINASVYAGEIPADVDGFANLDGQYKPTRTNIELWNAVKATPSSNDIPAGGSISADVYVTAGRRIAVSLPKNTTSLDITMVGAYDPIDYSADYDLLTLTALGKPTTTGRTYYTDAGTTVVDNGTDVWGWEYYNNTYQWDSSKLYNIVVRYEPLNETDRFNHDFIAGFGTEVRTKTVYNCNSLCNSEHWKGVKNFIIPFFDYIGTIQPLSGYPVYTTFIHDDKCKIYVKEIDA